MQQKKIQILATSDIHGYVMPTKFGHAINEPLGLAKIATIIEEKRQQAPTLLIENGDFIQGSPLTYYQYKYEANEANAMIELANAMHYDAAVFGNHEFNYGHKIFEQAVKEANYPYLAANIVDDNGKSITQPYMIKEVDGVRLAVLGVTTQFVPVWEAPEHITGIHFEDAFNATKQWVTYLKQNEQYDVLIVAYHGGFERDFTTGELIEADSGENVGYRICKEIDDIDILISGHQHREIATTLFGKSVIQPGTKGVCLGEITLTVTLEGDKVTAITHKPTLQYVDENTQPQQKIVDLHAAIYARTQHWLDDTMGTIKGDIHFDNAFEARVKEHPYVELINRIQMEVADVTISSTALFHDEPGGLPNTVTMRDIVTNYIYPNTIKVLRLSGADIIAALERCAEYFAIENGELVVSQAFKYPKAEPYNYDMWEGIDYTFDITKPVGQRVVRAEKDGKALDVTAKYDVVMNNYRATGAGGYPMFEGKPVIKDIQIDMTELIADYFAKHPVIEAQCNDNWKVIY